MSLYTNSTDVSIADMARLTFHEVVNNERTELISLVMHVEHLKNLAETIAQTLNQHKANNS